MVLEATVVLATLMDSENMDPTLRTGTPVPNSDKPQDVPDVMELIASSQGSPIIDPPALMQLLSQADHSGGLGVPEEACASATSTPASTTVTRATCWLFIFTANSLGGYGSRIPKKPFTLRTELPLGSHLPVLCYCQK
uniref:Uncharacterized protein n=1 Tax=Seriola lalandi dorsalis TaxID=1841481 RepID=A0A3B4XND4_SERLL